MRKKGGGGWSENEAVSHKDKMQADQTTRFLKSSIQGTQGARGRVHTTRHNTTNKRHTPVYSSVASCLHSVYIKLLVCSTSRRTHHHHHLQKMTPPDSDFTYLFSLVSGLLKTAGNGCYYYFFFFIYYSLATPNDATQIHIFFQVIY